MQMNEPLARKGNSILDKFTEGTEIEAAYLKFGCHGESGSGKSTLTVLGAIAMHKHLVAQGHPDAAKGIAMIDSEGGSDYVKPRLKREGIKFLSLKTRAAADMFATLKDPEIHAACHSLIIDSATHYWREFMASYMVAKKRTRLLIDDWGYLKPKWNEEFTVPYLNSPMHIFMAGRSGDDLEETKDEDGKKKLVKVGVKMKVEGETAYEPSLLFYLEAEQLMVGNDVSSGTRHKAHVFKDRFDVIQGNSFQFETTKDEAQDVQVKRVWSWIAPHVKMLNLGGTHKPISAESSAGMHPKPDGKSAWQFEAEARDIANDKLKTLLSCEINTATAVGKKTVAGLLAKHAGTESMTEVEGMKSDRITDIYEAIHQELRGCTSQEFIRRTAAPAKPTLDQQQDADLAALEGGGADNKKSE